MPSSVMAAPPQTMAVDFQARALTNSFWLRKEMTNAGLFAPFINTTGGVGLKSDGLGCTWLRLESRPELRAKTGAGGALSSTAIVSNGTPAADHASGLVMPARFSAAAIFACWLISRVVEGASPLASLMISGTGSCSEELIGAEWCE